MEATTFYSQHIKELNQALAKSKQQLLVSSLIRLGVFVFGVYGIYFLWNIPWMAVLLGAITLGLFLKLVARHADLKEKQELQQLQRERCQTELQVMDGAWSHLSTGSRFMPREHAYASDIDLFGKHSLFQLLNRTVLHAATALLARWLLANDPLNVAEKQQAVNEFAALAAWRLHFTALAAQIKGQVDLTTLKENALSHEAYVPSLMRWLPYFFLGISLLLMIGFGLDWWTGYLPAAWFFLGLTIAGIYAKRTARLSSRLGKAEDGLQHYAKLLLELENTNFESRRLEDQRKRLLDGSSPPSLLLHQFSRRLNALDQRNNMLVGVLLNGFALWDLWQAYRLEQWIEAHAAKVGVWGEVIAYFDAMDSMATFSFNHPNYVFPTRPEEPYQMQCEELKHPLMPEEKAVANSIALRQEEFFIITGANMAGKSTFLRTVALSLLMTNLGLPLTASRAQIRPVKLISSMRTDDSLSANASYFYSELVHLKAIIEALEQEPHFVVLDEILKGTNSTDKALGSKKFMRKLLETSATGLIATHDLSLCTLAEEEQAIRNYFFEAEIKADELYFDYTLKPGICQNMNASFLLKKMGIVD
ncbi:MutS-related protein [Croceiramulus getboli]|nr:DNA mismatch repair protein MutS [Flavobacteriaceae bacterium YJPT1-3]